MQDVAATIRNYSQSLNKETAASLIEPIANDIMMLTQNRPHHATPLHPLLFLACLYTRAYAPAQPFLDIHFIDTRHYKIDVKDFLLTTYYAGNIYLGLRDFKRARCSFLSTITTPADSPSAIQIEAYKKYLLVCCILDHPNVQLPPYTSNIVQKVTKSSYCQAYNDLSNLFKNMDVKKIRDEVKGLMNVCRKDGNMGLLQEANHAANRTKIHRFSDIFSVISLDQLCQYLLLDPAQNRLLVLQYLMYLQSQGKINVSIDERNGFLLKFSERVDQQDLGKLEWQIERLHGLNDHLSHLSRELELMPEYLKRKKLYDEDAGDS